MKCYLCPKRCGVDREKSVGFCRAGAEMKISKIMLHSFEEPILTNPGEKSGAIFFSSCNLRCVYCQNYSISHDTGGKTITPAELAEIFKRLEEAGAGNIDLVTPTHFSNKIIEALKIYKPKVPVVYNTSGYESVETLKKLDGLVDIYLTDYKYSLSETAGALSLAPDYPKVIANALGEMKRQQPKNIFSGEKLVRGIIVRHLVLPSHAKESLGVLDNIKKILGKDAIVSIMSQYVPLGEAKNIKGLDRTLKSLEYKLVISHALELGLDQSLIQDMDSASASYTPDFGSKIIDID